MARQMVSRRSTLGRQGRARYAQAAVLALAASAALASSAVATDGTWINTASDNWSDAAAWANGNIADGSGATANFATIDPTADLTVTLDAAHTLGNLNFGDIDPTTAASWIVAGTNTLTLDGSTPTITVGALGTGKSATISAPITNTSSFTKAGSGTLLINNSANALTAITVAAGTLNGGDSGAGLGTATITIDGGATLGAPTASGNTWTMPNAVTIDASATAANPATFNSVNRMRMNGAVSGTGTLNFNVISTVSRMDLQNSWTGFTGTVNFVGSGTVRLGINALASGQPKFNASGWQAAQVDLEGSVSLAPNTNSGGNTILIGSLSGTSSTAQLGAHTAGGAATWSVGAMGLSTTFAGGIRGSENFAKNGTGSLVLTNSTILDTTGTFTVNNGVLQVDGNKSGTGTTSVNSTTTTTGILSGSGTVAGLVTVNSGGHLAAGTTSKVGTLNVGSLTLAAGSILDYEFNGSGNDLVNVATGSGLTINGGTFNLNNEGASSIFSTDGSYNLIGYSGAINGAGISALAVAAGSQVSGKTYTFGATGSDVTLTISSGTAGVFWNKSTGGSWATGSNWTGNVAPNAQGAFAGLGGGGTPIAGNATITLDGDKTVGTLSFNDPNGHSYTVAAGTGGNLIIDNGTAIASITDAAGSHTISAPVTINGAGAGINVVAATDALTMSGPITASTPINKTGEGTLVLGAANPNFTGSITPSAGTIQVADPNALAAATLNPGAGAVTVTSGSSLNVGTLGIIASPGTLTVNSPVTVSVGDNGSDVTLVGGLGGSATLVKNGAGTLTLNGISSGAVGLTVNGGTVNVTSAQTYAGDTNLNSGTTLSIASGGGLNASSTIHMANNSTLTLANTSNTATFLGSNVLVAAGATANVTSAILNNGYGGAFSSGDATSVLAIGGNTSFSASGTNKQFSGFTGTVQVASGSTLRFSATSLNNGGDNTTFDVEGLLQTRNNGAVSLGALTGSGTLGGGQAATYTGTITYSIGAKGTDTTFAGNITEKDSAHPNAITKVGTASLTLAGTNTYSGATTVSAGTLVLASDAAYPSTSALVMNGGTLDLNGHAVNAPSLAGTSGTILTSNNLTVGSGNANTTFSGTTSGTGTLTQTGTGVLTLAGANLANLTVAAGAKAALAGTTATTIGSLDVSAGPLDVSTGSLVLPNATPEAVRQMLAAGRGSGAWDGTTGLTTSANAGNALLAVGYATDGQLGATSFNGVSGLTSSEVVLAGTYYGDLNLDGKVNADDYTLLDRGYAKHLTGWINGDVNYDGVVNSADYLLVDTSFGKLTGQLPESLLTQREAQFGPAYVAALTAAVPEPASLGLLGLGAVGLLSRRRRSK